MEEWIYNVWRIRQVIPDNILNSSVEIVKIYPNTQLISGQAFTITENIKFYNIFIVFVA